MTGMRAYVGITDYEWFRFLSARRDLDEVNFWKPGGKGGFSALEPGEIFLFKLHAPRNFIVGGGYFAHFAPPLPATLAWESFGDKNGAASFDEMLRRIAKYRKEPFDPAADPLIGCVLLEQPFFFPEESWIPAPRDWQSEIVQGKGYDLTSGVGREIWDQLQPRLASLKAPVIEETSVVRELPGPAYGEPVLVRPRLGQGTFRVVVTDSYERRCAVTGEKTLPVLQAAHIKPFRLVNTHEPRNGLLLRSDIHTLFDKGYVTVMPDCHFEVSRRLKEDWENGRDYYALHGREIRVPRVKELRPDAAYLSWHAEQVFRG
jgi:putative restriction endonuclease